jgi:VanZ family protein
VFLTTICYSIFVAIVSLIRLDDLPDLEISFGDKIYHFGAYGILTALWFFTFMLKFNYKIKRALFLSVISAVFFGIILEVLQGSLTQHRAFDFYDALANTIGALLASLVLWATKSFYIKNI